MYLNKRANCYTCTIIIKEFSLKKENKQKTLMGRIITHAHGTCSIHYTTMELSVAQIDCNDTGILHCCSAEQNMLKAEKTSFWNI
jgi:glycine cleavage system protein P-like pyridoxal-binding family